MANILFLTDLDHNLLQSHRVDTSGVHVMTVKKDGTAHCFATKAQHELFSLMSQNAFCIPVTARNPDQMSRVVGWQTHQQHDLALTNLGMTLMYRQDKGPWEIITEWSDEYVRIAKGRLFGLQVDFAQLKATLEAACPDGAERGVFKYSTELCEDNETPCHFSFQIDLSYLQIVRPSEVRKLCQQFLNECQGRYAYHESENTFCFWPDYVGKTAAVQRLMGLFEADDDLGDMRLRAAITEKGKSDLILTAGDSLSDLGFMRAGHFWMTPSVSQISDLTELPDMLTTDSYEGL